MCLHTASSIVSLASAVKVLHSFLDRSSSGTYSAQLVQQCLSLSLMLRVAFERLMAELFVVAWAASVILELSRLNQEFFLLLGSKSAGCVVMALAPVQDNLSSTDGIDGDLVMGGIVVQGGQESIKTTLTSPDSSAICSLKFLRVPASVTAERHSASSH